MTATDHATRRASRRWAAAAFGCALAPYVAFAQWRPGFWDTGEAQTVPWILGLMHPTGFPAWVLLGWLASHALPLGTVAFRLSALSGVATAVAVLALYDAARGFACPPRVAFTGALAFALSEDAFIHATRAEVHALALGFAATAAALVLRWARGGRAGMLLGAAAAAGLAIATHPVALWTLAGLAALALARRRPPPALAAASLAVLAVLAVAPYGYVPLRAAQLRAVLRDPPFAHGVYSGMPFWDYGDPTSPQRLWWYLTAHQFDTRDGLATYGDPRRLLAAALGFADALQRAYLGIGPVAAVAGAAVLWARDRRLGLALALFGALGVPFALGYTLESDHQRYLLIPLWTAGVLATVGLDALLRSAAFARLPRPAAVAALAFAGVAVVCGDVALDAYGVARPERAAAFERRVEAVAPPGAVVVAPWIYATPLAYGAYVEGGLRDRVVITGEPLEQAASIAGWSRTLCVLLVSDAPALRLPIAARLVPLGGGAPFVFRVEGAGAARCANGERGR